MDITDTDLKKLEKAGHGEDWAGVCTWIIDWRSDFDDVDDATCERVLAVARRLVLAEDEIRAGSPAVRDLEYRALASLHSMMKQRDLLGSNAAGGGPG